MSEQAVSPLEASTPTRLGPTAVVLVEIGAEIARLEEELADLEWRRAGAEHRLEVEDLASPFANRSVELGVSLAEDILRQGRADIRALLVEARSAAEARTADALREAMDILTEARAEVDEAMDGRAGAVEAVLMDQPRLPSGAGSALLVGPAEVPFHPSVTEARPGIELSSDASVVDDGSGTVVAGAVREPSTRSLDPATVVALLEASIDEAVVVPLGSDVASPPTGDPASSGDPATPVQDARRSDRPAPPDPSGGRPEMDEEVFADLGRPDPADPFVGDTPATTSVPVAALADLAANEAPSSTLRLDADADAEADADPEAGPGVGSTESAELVTGIVDGSPTASFWGEQEAARRRRWLRPVEILVPMVLALVVFVVLLLWIG